VGLRLLPSEADAEFLRELSLLFFRVNFLLWVFNAEEVRGGKGLLAVGNQAALHGIPVQDLQTLVGENGVGIL